MRRSAAASLTAATATTLLLLRPTHSRVIMPAAITGRDSTVRYSAMRGPTAAWRAMAQGGLIRKRWRSLSDLDCSTATMGESRIDAPASSRPLDKRTISEAVRTSHSGQERSFKEVESKLACRALSPLAASEAID